MKRVRFLLSIAATALAFFNGTQVLAEQETIVAIRHGEKPAAGLGQLSCKGLNRALALPKILIGKYGKANLIFAPDPSEKVSDLKTKYSYVRPVLTIGPTAIQLGLPVNAEIGYSHASTLLDEVTKKENENAVIFVAWEHFALNELAKKLLKKYDGDPSAVPDWPYDDFDRIYVFKITKNDGKPEIEFHVDHENLNDSLSNTCPGQ
jgi:hypothetical protein